MPYQLQYKIKSKVLTPYIIVYDQYGDVRIFHLTKDQAVVFYTYMEPADFVRDHMAEKFGIEVDNSFIFSQMNRPEVSRERF